MQVAPSQISPGETFDVWYFLRNHTDATTYYIRAKVYDVRTGELLDTVNLDQSSTNTRLFIKTATAPADPTGYGRNIVAIATVYTDSGYTTKSETYEEQEQYYLIKTVVPFMGGGGGVDYDTLRELVEKAFEKKLQSLPKPTPFPDMPWDSLFGALGALQREVNRVPKELPDLAPILAAIGQLEAKLDAHPIFEKTDLTPVIKLRTEVRVLFDSLKEALTEAVASSGTKNADVLKTLIADLYKKLEAGVRKESEDRTASFLTSQGLSLPGASDVPQPERTMVESPIDLRHLM